MKTFCIAICDKCGIGRCIFVSNPTCTKNYLEDQDADIQKFVETHIHCSLDGMRFIATESQLDKLWESGWKKVDKEYVLVDKQRKLGMKMEEFKRLMEEFCESNETKLKHYTIPSEYYYLFLYYGWEEIVVVFTPEEIEDCSWNDIETKIKKVMQNEIDDINKSIEELQLSLNALQERRNNLKSIT